MQVVNWDPRGSWVNPTLSARLWTSDMGKEGWTKYLPVQNKRRCYKKDTVLLAPSFCNSKFSPQARPPFASISHALALVPASAVQEGTAAACKDKMVFWCWVNGSRGGNTPALALPASVGSEVARASHLPVLSPSPGDMARAPTVLVESGCRGVPGM